MREAIRAFPAGRFVPSLVALLAVTIGSARCASAPPVPGSERIYATWEWVGSVGGLAGIQITPYSEQVRVLYRFEPPGALEVIREGQSSDRTRFRIAQEPGRAGAPPQTVIRYAEPVNVFPPPQEEQLLRFEGLDTLVLTDVCADCFEHTFVRLSP